MLAELKGQLDLPTLATVLGVKADELSWIAAGREASPTGGGAAPDLHDLARRADLSGPVAILYVFR